MFPLTDHLIVKNLFVSSLMKEEVRKIVPTHCPRMWSSRILSSGSTFVIWYSSIFSDPKNKRKDYPKKTYFFSKTVCKGEKIGSVFVASQIQCISLYHNGLYYIICSDFTFLYALNVLHWFVLTLHRKREKLLFKSTVRRVSILWDCPHVHELHLQNS
jgi:hypothetical protein